MPSLRMVPVTTVANGFAARVIAARLGSEGIVTQLRGNLDGPYPVGDVEVLVSVDELDVASEILLADEVESALDATGAGTHDEPPAPGLGWWAVAVVALLVGFTVVHVLARG
ncbi:MAG: hypothetical protein ACRDZ9_01230 [Acidimicrobiales bacterium]